MHFVLIAHNAIVGEASENRLHVMRVTRVDIALNHRVESDEHSFKKDSAISAAAQILGFMPFSIMLLFSTSFLILVKVWKVEM